MEAFCTSSRINNRTFGVIIGFILQDNDERCRIKESAGKNVLTPWHLLILIIFRNLNEVQDGTQTMVHGV